MRFYPKGSLPEQGAGSLPVCICGRSSATTLKRLARAREKKTNASGRSGPGSDVQSGPSRGLGPSGPARRGPVQGRTTSRPTFRRERGFYCKLHDSRVFRRAGGLRVVSLGQHPYPDHVSRYSKKVRASVKMVHQSCTELALRQKAASGAQQALRKHRFRPRYPDLPVADLYAADERAHVALAQSGRGPW